MPETQKPCLFCAIVEGKIPVKKVYEDNDSIAFLDIHPRSKGMTIVAPKRHYAEMGENYLQSLKTFEASETVSEMIKQALGPRTIEASIIPSEEVPHFHIRLYPVYLDERPIMENEPLKVSEQELDEMANSIKSQRVDVFKSVKQEARPAEKEWSEEDAKYIRNQLEKT